MISTYPTWAFTLHDGWLRIHVEHGVWVDHKIGLQHRFTYILDSLINNGTNQVLNWRFCI